MMKVDELAALTAQAIKANSKGEASSTSRGAEAGRTGIGAEAGAREGKTASGALPLEPGRLIQGRVLSFSADGRVVLDLAGWHVETRSSIPLTPGREFWFEVRQGSAGLQLVPAGKQEAIHRFLQQAAGGLQDLGRLTELLASLRQGPTGAFPVEIAEQLSRLTLGSNPAPEKIMQLISWLTAAGSGQAHATSLTAQLQALLRVISQAQAQAQQGGHEKPRAMGRISGMLEAMVGINEQPASPNQASFWLFPCFFSLGAGAGSWLFSRELTDDQESSSLLFFLELSNLGELQLEIKQRGNHLDGNFLLAKAEAAEFLRGHLRELRQCLQDLGYQAVFRCHGGALPLLPALKDALEKATGSAPRKLIDIKA